MTARIVDSPVYTPATRKVRPNLRNSSEALFVHEVRQRIRPDARIAKPTLQSRADQLNHETPRQFRDQPAQHPNPRKSRLTGIHLHDCITGNRPSAISPATIPKDVEAVLI
jgi:hypothetical protein